LITYIDKNVFDSVENEKAYGNLKYEHKEQL